MKKKIKILKIYALLAFLFFNNILAFSQVGDIGKFLVGGTDDASKILGAYIKPYTSAFGYDLSAGWYNTAKVHSLLGFDLTLNFDMAFIPNNEKTFDVKALGLSTTDIGTPSIAQTIAGKNNTGPEISYSTTINSVKHDIAKYNTPGGANLGFSPLAMVQVGLGLIKGTEIIGRFLPTISFGKGGNTKVSLWGIGLKHSIKQWIPAIDELPFLNLSIMGAYSKFHMVNDISLDPFASLPSYNFYLANNISVSDTLHNFDFSNQKLDFSVTSFTLNAIASLDFPVITLYAGLGISSTSADIKMLGNYALPRYYSNQNLVYVHVQDVKSDPVSISLKGGTKPRLNIGFKIKMGVLALHFDYTNASYSIVTAGLGIGFR